VKTFLPVLKSYLSNPASIDLYIYTFGGRVSAGAEFVLDGDGAVTVLGEVADGVVGTLAPPIAFLIAAIGAAAFALAAAIIASGPFGSGETLPDPVPVVSGKHGFSPSVIFVVPEPDIYFSCSALTTSPTLRFLT
jgi:hypothetical protein